MEKEKISTEQAILAAAEEIFLTKGYAATKTTEIAKQAGVNHAMLHYYFRTKASLFDKVFEEKARIFTGSFFSVFGLDLPFEEKIRIAVGKHYDFLVANPRLPMFIMGEVLMNEERKEQVKKILLPKLMKLTRDLQVAIDDEVKKGAIKHSLSVDTIINAVSLNIFSVVFTQLVANQDKYLEDNHIQDILQHRRETNINMVMKGLGL